MKDKKIKQPKGEQYKTPIDPTDKKIIKYGSIVCACIVVVGIGIMTYVRYMPVPAPPAPVPVATAKPTAKPLTEKEVQAVQNAMPKPTQQPLSIETVTETVDENGNVNFKHESVENPNAEDKNGEEILVEVGTTPPPVPRPPKDGDINANGETYIEGIGWLGEGSQECTGVIPPLSGVLVGQ
ncbi:MAG: hypothetical protein RR052_03285 [Oscillospiraceae bacterium]